MQQKILIVFMRIKILIITILIMLNVKSSFANSSHCNTLSGWHFYCEEEKIETVEELKEEKQDIKPIIQKEQKTDQYYLNRIEEIKQRVEILKAKMIIEPTQENIINYVKYQRYVLDKASYLTDAWQRTMWQTPELDYTLQRPVSKIGKETYLDQKKLEKANLLQELSKRYGIFFAFRSDCLYCHQFAPVVKMLEERGFSIIPISLDGGYLPEFSLKITKTHTGQLSKLGIEIDTVPALFLFDAKTNEIITIGFGFMAFDEVEERIYILTSKEIGEDY